MLVLGNNSKTSGTSKPPYHHRFGKFSSGGKNFNFMTSYQRLFNKTLIDNKIQNVINKAKTINYDINSFKIDSLTKLKTIQDYKIKFTNCNCNKFNQGILSIKSNKNMFTTLHYYECKSCKQKYFEEDDVLELIDDANKELSK